MNAFMEICHICQHYAGVGGVGRAEHFVKARLTQSPVSSGRRIAVRAGYFANANSILHSNKQEPSSVLWHWILEQDKTL
jgi:hypothetical protein